MGVICFIRSIPVDLGGDTPAMPIKLPSLPDIVTDHAWFGSGVTVRLATCKEPASGQLFSKRIDAAKAGTFKPRVALLCNKPASLAAVGGGPWHIVWWAQPYKWTP